MKGAEQMGKMKNLILGLLIFCFCMFTIVPTSMAGTPNVSTNFTHSSISSDYGIKSFVYEVGYNSIQRVVNSSDKVNSHDFAAYKSYAIYSPEVGNGDAGLMNIKLVNASSGSTIQTLSRSSFSNGTHRGFIIGGNDPITWQLLKSDSSLIGSPSSTGYRVKVTTEFYLDDSWAPNYFSDSCNTGAF